MRSYPYAFPTYATCCACGDRHERDLRGEDLDREVLTLLEQLSGQPLSDESPLCVPCVADARREYRERAEEERAADEREALAARDAWVAAMEAEGDPSPPPWSSQWDPTVDALCGRRAA